MKDETGIVMQSLAVMLAQMKQKPVKKCLLVETGGCSPDIIHAHSVQNAYTLGQLEENGHVYMFGTESSSTFPILKLVGRNKATVFTGFCGRHDNDLFKEIDLAANQAYDKDNSRLACLYFLRSCAHEYWKKLNVIENYEKLRSGTIPGFTPPADAVGFRRRLDISIRNAKSGLLDQKIQFESLQSQVNKNKFHLTLIKNIVLNSQSRFAVSAAFSPEYDFEGHDLFKNGHHPAVDEKWPIFSMLVLPMGGQTLVQLCAHKKHKMLFEKFVQSLQTVDIKRYQEAISRVALSHSENIVISPRLVDGMSQLEKDNLCELFTETMMSGAGDDYIPNLF